MGDGRVGGWVGGLTNCGIGEARWRIGGRTAMRAGTLADDEHTDERMDERAGEHVSDNQVTIRR